MLLKIAHYWYLTPARVATWDPREDGMCWRKCSQRGTLTHLLWQCPKIGPYWSEILGAVNTLFNTDIPRLPTFILLGLPNPLTYPLTSPRGKAITLMLGAAKQLLLARWGTDRIPSHQDWLYKIWDILEMEKLTAVVTQQLPRFDMMWQPGIAYLADEFRELICPQFLRILRLTQTEPNTHHQATSTS